MSPEEMSQAGNALIAVSLISALLLSFLILLSRWHGLKLIGAVMLVQFGVETFMAQIETLYFNSAVQMGTDMFLGIVAAGAVRALVYAPLAVLILGKMMRPAQPRENREPMALPGLGRRLVALAVLYVVVYFTFGYLVAWQWEEVRVFYSGTSEIKPFFVHFRDLFLEDDPAIIPFQLVRGALWASLALVIVQMTGAKRWVASLAVAMVFAGLLSVPVGLFPNPYMPPMVRQAHFYEIAFSMLLFGGIAGWALHANGAPEMTTVRDGATGERDPLVCR
jgi:hypothetical protein